MSARTTPLYPIHAAAGASFTEFGGWDMPLRYTSDVAEHHAVRRSGGIFDLSHMGEVKVCGPQAGEALDFALTGAPSKIAVGRARYMMIVAEDGGILDDLIVYRLGEEQFLVVPNAGNRERVATALSERCVDFAGAQVRDESEETALIAVQGPRAEEVLRGVVTSGVAVPAALRPEEGAPAGECAPDVLCGPSILRRLRYYAAVPATAAGHEILLARTGYTGEDGFELFCHGADAADVWEQIVGYAEGLEPTHLDGPDGTDGTDLPALALCGLAARDSLRLEAGMPLYGHELTEELTPFDVGLGSVVAAEKGEFVGRAALERRRGQECLSLVGLTGEGKRAARAGCEIADGEGRPIGVVTSGLLSPTLGYPVALARLRAGVAVDPGEVVSVDVRGKTLPMRVVPLPFYKRAK